METADFLAAARARYVAANAAALRWMLDRPRRHGAFVDTKMNAVTLRDYGPGDGWRGPDVTFGWIQGRALEAIATHAAFFESTDPALARRLDEAGRALYAGLKDLHSRHGHGYFAYDADLKPVWPDADGVLHPQADAGDLFTFSDTFVRKGLVAAAARYAPAEAAAHVERLLEVVRAIEDGRFVSDERQRLDDAAGGSIRDEYGPRMILLGAAAMLRHCGFAEAAAFGRRFIDHVLARHRTTGGTLADVPGEDGCNPGHAIEFAGFGLEWLEGQDDDATVRALGDVLAATARIGFHGPGIALKVSLASGRPTSPNCPWWSLPETIRAAALLHARTRDAAALALWRRADEAFFTRYWRVDPPVAFQTLTADGPIDVVPATPDLDPGYHTGLSLLAALRVAGDAA
ncbi:AGE family epimerase/isomerase [Alsobacter sp. R-9]